RELTFKVNELQNCCDDYESEKRDLLRIKVEYEKKILSLEEKCRFKERELFELRDANDLLQLSYKDKEDMKIEINRLKDALESSQLNTEIVAAIEKENNDLLRENSVYRKRIKELETEVSESKTDRGWRLQYEQAKEALEKAEKTIYEFMRDSERSKAESEAEVLSFRLTQCPSTNWAFMTRAKCTCTCHHPELPPQVDGDSRPDSVQESGEHCSTPSSIRPPETTQNMDDISVVDVSLWRDTRTGSTPSEVNGECLGEVMAYDTKIQELEIQLTEARYEINRLNEEVSRLSLAHDTLSDQHSASRENLEVQLSSLTLEKEILLNDLDEKRLALEKVNAEQATLSHQFTQTSNNLKAVQTEANLLKAELNHVMQTLETVTKDRECQCEKVLHLESEKNHLIEEGNKLKEVQVALEDQLTNAQKSVELFKCQMEEKLSALEVQLTETQEKYTSTEAINSQLVKQLDLLQKEKADYVDRERVLGRQLSATEDKVTFLTSKLQETNLELNEKVQLMENLKTKNADLIVAREVSDKVLTDTQSSLSQAQADITRLSSELACALEANQRIEHLESSLGARESNIMMLNQALSDNQDVISRLSEEKRYLEARVKKLEIDVEAKTSTCTLLIGERDKAKDDYFRCAQDCSTKKERCASLLKTLEKVKADLAEHKSVNDKKSERFATSEEELSKCRERLSVTKRDLVHLSEKNQCLLEEIAKLSNEKKNLKQDLDEYHSRVTRQRGELSSLTDEVLRLQGEVTKCKEEIAVLSNEKSSLESKLEKRTEEIADLESQLTELQEQALERRLDNATAEHLSCEERLAAETVRCRQLEGVLNEKEAIINGLQHQLSVQRKVAQEKEASILLRYLNARAMQEETDKRFPFRESMSSIMGDMKRSFRSLDQLPHTLPNPRLGIASMSDFVGPTSGRLYSEILAPFSSPKRSDHEELADSRRGNPALECSTCVDVDMEQLPPEKSVIFTPQNTQMQKDTSPLFEERLPEFRQPAASVASNAANARRFRRAEPLMLTTKEASFLTPLKNGSHFVEREDVVPLTHAQFVHNGDVSSCTPVSSQGANTLESGSWNEVGPLIPHECQDSTSTGNVQTSYRVIYMAEKVEKSRCQSSASNKTTTSSESNPVSELANWPPYKNCAAPLSPQALCGGEGFAVPTPHDTHFRRLRRLLVAPAAEEMEADDILTCGDTLEAKPIPRRDQIKHPWTSSSHGFVPKGNFNSLVESTLMAADKPTPVEDMVVSRRKPSDCKADTGTTSHSALPTGIRCPTSPGLPRFHSVMELSDRGDTPFRSDSVAAIDSIVGNRALTQSRSHAAPPPSFRRFKERFNGKVYKSASSTPVLSSSPSQNVKDVERDSSSCSAKSKKSKKLRLSNVFKTKKKRNLTPRPGT
uniref:Nucleoprotein TPR n=1 Tax=Mesocestoides corti TaxID=53468 RepID=A0A5K3FNF7_MESCO